MNLPNKLTVLRVCLIPLFMAALLIDSIPYNIYIALGVLRLLQLPTGLTVSWQESIIWLLPSENFSILLLTKCW